MRALDVLLLGAFVTTQQKQDQLASFPSEYTRYPGPNSGRPKDLADVAKLKAVAVARRPPG